MRFFAIVERGLLLIVAAYSFPAAVQGEAPDKKTAAWVEQVTLGAEEGDDKSFIRRWVKSPSLSVMGGSAAQRKAAAEAVTELNEVLAKTPIKKIELLKPDDLDAEICVHLLPLARLTSKADELGVEHKRPLGTWLYWGYPNEKNELIKAHVLIAEDRFDIKDIHGIFLSSIGGSLGVFGFSTTFPESIFFRKGRQREKVKKMAELDEKLLVFLYAHLKPGDSRDEVRKALKANWK